MTALDDAPTALVPAESEPPRPGSRLQRARMPLAKDVVEAVAISHGVCIRPISMKTVNDRTGEVTFLDVPCGATLASKCPSCAERARRLRMHQCREGWHLAVDPDLTPDTPNDKQRELATARADMTAARDELSSAGDDLTAQAVTESLNANDRELAHAASGATSTHPPRNAASDPPADAPTSRTCPSDP